MFLYIKEKLLLIRWLILNFKMFFVKPFWYIKALFSGENKKWVSAEEYSILHDDYMVRYCLNSFSFLVDDFGCSPPQFSSIEGLDGRRLVYKHKKYGRVIEIELTPLEWGVTMFLVKPIYGLVPDDDAGPEFGRFELSGVLKQISVLPPSHESIDLFNDKNDGVTDCLDEYAKILRIHAKKVFSSSLLWKLPALWKERIT